MIHGSARSAGEGIGFSLQYLWASLVAQLEKNLPEMRLIPGLGRSPGEGKVYPLQYSGLENSMDCIAWGSRVGHDKQLSIHFRISKFSKITGYELNIYVNKTQLYLLNFQ